MPDVVAVDLSSSEQSSNSEIIWRRGNVPRNSARPQLRARADAAEENTDVTATSSRCGREHGRRDAALEDNASMQAEQRPRMRKKKKKRKLQRVPRERESKASSSAAVAAHSQRRSGGAMQASAQSTHLVAAIEEQGPDVLFEEFNEKTDKKSTLSLIVACFVVFPDFKAGNLNNLLINHPAGLLIVLFDPAVAGTNTVDNVVEAVMAESDHWCVTELGSAGVALYRDRVIRDVALVESVVGTGEASRLQTLRVVLRGNKMNPSTAVAVGVVSLVRESSAVPYSAPLLESIKSALSRNEVRILLGVFTCTQEQVADIARSCGASGTRPFCQLFHCKDSGRECTAELAQRFEVDPQHGGNYVTHPSYAIILGPASKLSHAPTKEVPDLPAWLEEDAIRFKSLCMTLPAIPSWEGNTGLRSCGDQLPDLCNVRQKCTNMELWVPSVHQLMIYVGSARKGRGAAEKQMHARKRKKKPNASVKKELDEKTGTAGVWSRAPQGELIRSCDVIEIEENDI